MSTIRLTLNKSLEEVIQELEQAYKPMSRTEIIKMVIAEFYNTTFASRKAASKSSSSSTAKNSQVIDKWLDNSEEPELEKGEVEKIFGDWWSENKKSLRK